MKWYVYIVEAKDKSLYTGITTDVTRRVSEHNKKIGAKSLKGKLPVKLMFNEECLDRSTASKREREIKGWKREQKIKLVKDSGFTLKGP